MWWSGCLYCRKDKRFLKISMNKNNHHGCWLNLLLFPVLHGFWHHLGSVLLVQQQRMVESWATGGGHNTRAAGCRGTLRDWCHIHSGRGSTSEEVELVSRFTQSSSPWPTFLTWSFNGGGPQSVSSCRSGDRGLFWLVLTTLGEKTGSLNVPISETAIDP